MFAPPAPTYSLGGGPPDVQRRFALAFTEEIKLELLAAAAAVPGRWLGWNDFAAVRDKHQIGFCMGYVLSSLVRDGRLLGMICWLGAERPGTDTEYKGFSSRWRVLA
jgi:hypothetical protein